MSFDTLVSLVLFVGAIFLMMRFGCGAHMGHAHNHGRATSDQPGRSNSAGLASLNGANSDLPAKGAETERAPEGKAHRHGCC